MAPPPSPPLYRIETIPLVERALEALQERAFAANRGKEFESALEEIYRRLQIYPQYGEIHKELKQGEAVYTSRAFTIPPLFVEYIVDELNRRVYITAPLKAMPHSGFE